MKKIASLLLLPAFIILLACNSSKKTENSTTASGKADTSQNSLDWEGSYTGSLPCEDCAGILTQVDLLQGNRYRMESNYLGRKADPVIREGIFSWNKDQNKITLDTAGFIFQVGENKLTRLDDNGNKITGDQADRYTLIKQDPVAERYWKLTELYGNPVTSPQEESRIASITFDKSQLQVSGSGGCNSFSGGYTMSKGNKVTFSPLISTKMACDIMEQESQFFKALSETVSYIVKDDQLSFRDSTDATVARFINVMRK